MEKVDHYPIGKVWISQTDPVMAKQKILQKVKSAEGGYICIGNMRTIVYANQHKDYCQVVNEAQMNLPDGMPLVWCARAWRLKNVQRTVGPDLFVSLLSEKENGLRHFLVGDTEETLSKLKTKYPDVICGTLSPPFVEWKEFDYLSIAEKIRASGANIVWTAMRAPKQDFFNRELAKQIPKILCLGVGAGFRFALGQYKHPSSFWQKTGLTGLFWIRGNACKEIFWYIKHTCFLFFFLLDIFFKRCETSTKK